MLYTRLQYHLVHSKGFNLWRTQQVWQKHDIVQSQNIITLYILTGCKTTSFQLRTLFGLFNLILFERHYWVFCKRKTRLARIQSLSPLIYDEFIFINVWQTLYNIFMFCFIKIKINVSTYKKYYSNILILCWIGIL